jgi:hypothetical protein
MKCAALFLLLVGLAGPALAQDTFTPEQIARTRAFWEQNASSSDHMDCITTLNHAIHVLYDDPNLQLGSRIDRTMTALRGYGLASAPRMIEFNDERGKLTYGVTAPATLRESVWDTAIALTGGARGWSVFGMSLMDGYHSVALTVDTTDPAHPTIYWCDQWSSNGGFRAHTKESLDAEVTRLTTAWWDSEKKFRTRCTLWRLTPRDTSVVATITAGPLNVRSGAGPQFPIVERVAKGAKLRVLGKQGLWLKVARADGSTGYIHSAFARTNREPLPAGSVTAAAAPLAPITHDPPSSIPTAPEPTPVATDGLTGAIAH